MEREITITVTDDEARRIEERAASAGFGSPAEYVHATLADALQQPVVDISDDLLRQLLEDDDADSSPDVGIDEAFAEVHRHIEELAAKNDATS